METETQRSQPEPQGCAFHPSSQVFLPLPGQLWLSKVLGHKSTFFLVAIGIWTGIFEAVFLERNTHMTGTYLADVSWLQQESAEELIWFPRGRVGRGVDIQSDMEGDSEFGTVICTMLMCYLGKGQVGL